MNEEMATTGFTGGDTATGPTAGFDPVMKQKIRRKDLKGLVAPGNKLKAASVGANNVKGPGPDKVHLKNMHLSQSLM